MNLGMITNQQELELLYNKNLATTRIKTELTNAEFDFLGYFAELDIPAKFAMNMLTQMVLHKRTNMATMIGLLHKHADTPQQAAMYLEIAVHADLLDWDIHKKEFIVAVDISAEVQRDLDRYQYPLPMIIEPKQVRDNSSTGYLTSNNSIILKNNHHEGDVVLDHINRMNLTALRINFDVVDMIKNTWKNLDKQKEDETYQDFRKRQKAFAKYDKTAKDVMKTVTKHSDRIYLTHRYDKRLRTYCQGYHVNYAGNAWNKACIEFADGETLI